MNLTKEELLQEKERILKYQQQLTQEILINKGSLKTIGILLSKIEKKEKDAEKIQEVEKEVEVLDK